MLDTLAPGDVVTVTRIDRPARRTFDLFGRPMRSNARRYRNRRAKRSS
jgi:hypothetical protein